MHRPQRTAPEHATRSRAILAAMALWPLLAGGGCEAPYQVAQRRTRTLEHTLAIDAGVRRIEVQFHDGLLRLEAGAAPECSLAIDLAADHDLELGRLAMQVRPEVTAAEGGRVAKLSVGLPAGAAMDAVRTTWRLRAPAHVTVAVTTRRGGVVARQTPGDLEVLGGSGVVDVQMAGGTAQLTTTSGSMMLRGDYPFAELRSAMGRIDLRLPGRGENETEVKVHGGRGDCYLDVPPARQYELHFAGDQRLVTCDPETRIDWQVNLQIDGQEFVGGRVGDLQAPLRGRLQISAAGLLRVRRQPDGG